MIAECRDNGLPAPVWEEIGVRLRLTVRTAQVRPQRVDRKDRTILDVLQDGKGRGTREMAEQIELSAYRAHAAGPPYGAWSRVCSWDCAHDPRRKYILVSTNPGTRAQLSSPRPAVPPCAQSLEASVPFPLSHHRHGSPRSGFLRRQTFFGSALIVRETG